VSDCVRITLAAIVRMIQIVEILLRSITSSCSTCFSISTRISRACLFRHCFLQEGEVRKTRAFTIVELMVVISIILLLISFLLPSMAEARDHARYAKWAGYSHNLRIDPKLLVYFNFEQQGVAGPDMGRIWNRSALDALEMARRDLEPEYFHGDFLVGTQPQTGGGSANQFQPDWQPDRRWVRGRWRAKGSLIFDNRFHTQTPHDEAMNFELEPGHSWTIMSWINTIKAEPWDGVLTKAINNRGSYALEIQPASAGKATLKLEAANGPNGGNFTATGNIEFPENTWVHGTLVYDGLVGEYRFYVNGRLDKVIAKPNCRFVNKEAFVIGMDNPGLVEYWEGRMDELAIFGGALAPGKILEHFEIGRPRRLGGAAGPVTGSTSGSAGGSSSGGSSGTTGGSTGGSTTGGGYAGNWQQAEQDAKDLKDAAAAAKSDASDAKSNNDKNACDQAVADCNQAVADMQTLISQIQTVVNTTSGQTKTDWQSALSTAQGELSGAQSECSSAQSECDAIP